MGRVREGVEGRTEAEITGDAEHRLWAWLRGKWEQIQGFWLTSTPIWARRSRRYSETVVVDMGEDKRDGEPGSGCETRFISR